MGKASGVKQRRLQKAKIMHEVLRMRKLQSNSITDDDNDNTTPALNEDEWISCQADVNKLVQSGKIEDDFSDDALSNEAKPGSPEVHKDCFDGNQPGAPEETRKVFFEEARSSSPEEPQKGYFEVPKLDSPEEKPFIEVNEEIDDKTKVIPEPEKWVVKNQVCRCCLTEGTFDSLHSPAAGDFVTYDFILTNCFNIQVSAVSSNVVTALRGICGLCAARLRDAHAFRHQIFTSEARFRDLYIRNCITVPGAVDVKPKLEVPCSDDDFEIDEAEVTAAPLPEAKPKPKRTPPKKREAKKQTKNQTKTQPKQKKVVKTPPKKTQKKTTLENRLKPGPKSTLSSEYYTRIGDEYTCRACEKVFRGPKNMLSHYKVVHLKIRRVPRVRCQRCGLNCKTATRLTLHKLEEHNIDDRYRCSACDKVFNRKVQLRIHKDNFHMLGEKINCSMCDFESYSQRNFKRHLVSHQTTKDFHCQYCKKSFLRKGTLIIHEKIHTGDKQKQCTECGQAFVQKASLNYHMSKYHPAESISNINTLNL